MDKKEALDIFDKILATKITFPQENEEHIKAGLLRLHKFYSEMFSRMKQVQGRIPQRFKDYPKLINSSKSKTDLLLIYNELLEITKALREDLINA